MVLIAASVRPSSVRVVGRLYNSRVRLNMNIRIFELFEYEVDLNVYSIVRIGIQIV